jgi:hypothetical protein
MYMSYDSDHGNESNFQNDVYITYVAENGQDKIDKSNYLTSIVKRSLDMQNLVQSSEHSDSCFDT